MAAKSRRATQVTVLGDEDALGILSCKEGGDQINQDQECSAPNVSDHSKETDATNLQSDEAVELCAGMTVVISSRFKRLNGQKATVLSLLKDKVKVQMDNQEVKKFAPTALTVCDSPENQGEPPKRQRT